MMVRGLVRRAMATRGLPELFEYLNLRISDANPLQHETNVLFLVRPVVYCGANSCSYLQSEVEFTDPELEIPNPTLLLHDEKSLSKTSPMPKIQSAEV